MNPSSSYLDGSCLLSLGCRSAQQVFPGTDFVYTHMDLNPVVRPLSDPFSDINLVRSRSTLPASFCLGIVLMSTTSKPPLKRNAVTGAPNHTGTGHSVRSCHHAPPAELTFSDQTHQISRTVLSSIPTHPLVLAAGAIPRMITKSPTAVSPTLWSRIPSLTRFAAISQ